MRVPALAFAVAVFAAAAPALAQAPSSSAVSVLYDASLAQPMEGPIASALRGDGLEVAGEPGGSKQLASLIASGGRKPDAFICVDRALVDGLGDKVASATTFATTRLGIGVQGKSNYDYVFASVARGETPWLVALGDMGLRFGRTDPELDPKGQYTIDAMTLLLSAANEKRILGVDENPTQIYPEAELPARLAANDFDVGFFYEVEAISHRISFVPFPGAVSMHGTITFTLAIMKDAPHPAAAQQFARFILEGQGRRILEQAGLEYTTPEAGSP